MVKVFRSTVVAAPVERVWAVIRDFNSHERWHPAVAHSEIEGGKAPDQVGCVRRFRLRDGGTLREQLLKLSDAEHSFTYCILQAPLPLEGYVATVSLTPVTDGARTLWTWSSEFETPAGREEELTRLVGEGIYERGFDAVRTLLGDTVPARRHAPAPQPARAGSAPATASSSTGAMQAGAIRVHRHGGPEELRWETVSVPPPGRGEVRLRHSAIGVNYIDVYARTGYFALLKLPDTPGLEGVGTVLDVGEGVTGIESGMRVGYACLPPGAYAEVRTMPADLLVALPDDISDEVAAGGLLKGMTAEFLLHRVHAVRPGETVLVHAAAGGVGLLLCQWASHLGATVIGTVGSQEKARLARANGCAHPLLRGAGFAEEVRALTGGRGVDVIYDAVGRDSFAGSFAALAERGHLVSYGQASGDIGPVEIAGYASKSATVSRPNFGHYTGTPEQVRAITDRLFDALRRGIVRVQVNQRFALREAAAAHRALEARTTTGSTILLP